MSRSKLTSPGAVALIVLISALLRAAIAQAADNDQFRWDIIHVNFATTPIELTAGGHTSASADDGSSITLTGSGTFKMNPGNPQDVTGGGTWSTSTGDSGTYEVTGLVSFTEAPGQAIGLDDDVCDACTVANSHAGLAVLKVAFDDGSEGVLTVSCTFEPPQTPASVFEGITVSKGFVDNFDREPGEPVNGNATIFHDLD